MAGYFLNGVYFIWVYLGFITNVKVFCIFAECDEIHIRERRLYSGIRFCRTDIGIQVIFVAQRYVQGTESFPIGVVIGDFNRIWVFSNDAKASSGMRAP